MAGGTYWKGYVGCPFYHSDDGRRRISCEGMVADSVANNVFRRRAQFEDQMRRVCCQDYKSCLGYHMAMEKYLEH